MEFIYTRKQIFLLAIKIILFLYPNTNFFTNYRSMYLKCYVQ